MTDLDPTRPASPSPESAPPAWPEAPTLAATRRRRGVGLIVALIAIVLLAGSFAGIVVTERSDRSSRFGFPGLGNSADGSGSESLFDGPSPSAADIDIDVRGIAHRVSPAIVNIATTLSSERGTAGSGLLISAGGLVLTNNHVINGATKVEVEVGVTGEKYGAKVLGYDVGDDVALLKLEDAPAMRTIKPASSSSLARTDPVVAIGNALGAFGEPAAVPGTITGLNQAIRAGDGLEREALPNMIRFVGSIHPGDSGGGLVNDAGHVVGMITAADPAAGRFGTRAGTTGFAIPIETALAIADQIRAGDESSGVHVGDRALLGVFLAGTDDGFIDGARVTGVDEGSPADEAGIGEGATITSVAGRAVRSSTELRTNLERYHPGERVRIRWTDSDGDPHHATVELVKGPPA